MIVLFPSIDTWIGSVERGTVLIMSASCRDWDKSIPMWAPTTPSSKINIQEAKVPWFHTSATRWRSKGAPVQLDQTEEQKEALSLHDSKRSAIGFRGKSGISKAVTRLGPRFITSYITYNWPTICLQLCIIWDIWNYRHWTFSSNT